MMNDEEFYRLKYSNVEQEIRQQGVRNTGRQIEDVKLFLACLLRNPELIDAYPFNNLICLGNYTYMYFYNYLKEMRSFGMGGLSAEYMTKKIWMEKERLGAKGRFGTDDQIKARVSAVFNAAYSIENSERIKVPEEEVEKYYQNILKIAALQELERKGINTEDFWMPDTNNPNKFQKKHIQDSIRRFNESDVEDIIRHYTSIINSIGDMVSAQSPIQSKHAGTGTRIVLAEMRQGKKYGLPYSSAFLTYATRGQLPGTFTLKSAGTNVGKTRNGLADICFAAAPAYWKDGAWRLNPLGMNTPMAYIGTEMAIHVPQNKLTVVRDEIEPIMLSYIADVPLEKILDNSTTKEEALRIDQAVCILGHANIHIIRHEDFTSSSLEDLIRKYKTQYGVEQFFFDYIETTPKMTAEFAAESGGNKLYNREDQILMQLSARLKKVCENCNVSINAYSQMSDKTADDEQGIKGAKALPFKADIGMIISVPTPEDHLSTEKYVEQYWNSRGEIDETKRYKPNIIYKVYKNRNGVLRGIKIYVYIDYSTMRTHDMFVTWAGVKHRNKNGEAGSGFESKEWDNPHEYLIGNNLYIDPKLNNAQREILVNKQYGEINLPQNMPLAKRVYMYLEGEDEYGCPLISVQNFKKCEENDNVILTPGNPLWERFLTDPVDKKEERNYPRKCLPVVRDGKTVYLSDNEYAMEYRKKLREAYARRIRATQEALEKELKVGKVELDECEAIDSNADTSTNS